MSTGDLPALHASAFVGELARGAKAKAPALTLSLLSGPDGNGNATISGHTYGKAKIVVANSANGSIEQTLKANNKGNFTFNVNLGYGSLSLNVTSTLRGKKPATASITINRPDTIPPSISLSSGISTLGNTQDVITGHVTDVGTGVSSLDVSVDNAAFQPLSFDGAGDFSYKTGFALNGSADGTHTIRFIAQDRAGNTSSVASGQYDLVTTGPNLTIPAGASGSSTPGNITIQGTAVDTKASLGSVKWNIDGGGYTPVAVDGSGNFNFTTALVTDGSDNGSHLITVEAADILGNITTSKIQFTLNAPYAAPTITSTLPGEDSYGAIVASHNITVIGTVPKDLTNVEESVDSGPYQPLSVDSSGNFSFTTSLALDGSQDGPHMVSVRGTDPASEVLKTSVNFVLDTVAPTISISSPAANSFTNQSPTITGTVTDATSGVATVFYKVDSGTLTALTLGSGDAFSIPTTFSTNGTADGSHTVTITATDEAGNVKTSSISFTLDTVKPTLTITPLTSSYTNTNPTITASAADSLSGLASLSWKLDNGTSTPISLSSLSNSGSFSFPTALKLDGTQDGSHTVTITATDKAGNVTTSTISFTLDTVPPVVSAQADSVNKVSGNWQLDVVGTATDATSGISTIEWSLGSGTPTTITLNSSGNFSFIATVPNVSGAYTIAIVVTDLAGNTTTKDVFFSVS